MLKKAGSLVIVFSITSLFLLNTILLSEGSGRRRQSPAPVPVTDITTDVCFENKTGSGNGECYYHRFNVWKLGKTDGQNDHKTPTGNIPFDSNSWVWTSGFGHGKKSSVCAKVKLKSNEDIHAKSMVVNIEGMNPTLKTLKKKVSAPVPTSITFTIDSHCSMTYY